MAARDAAGCLELEKVSPEHYIFILGLAFGDREAHFADEEREQLVALVTKHSEDG